MKLVESLLIFLSLEMVNGDEDFVHTSSSEQQASEEHISNAEYFKFTPNYPVKDASATVHSSTSDKITALVKRTAPLENLEPSRTQESSAIIRTTSTSRMELKPSSVESYTQQEIVELPSTAIETLHNISTSLEVFSTKIHHPVTRSPYESAQTTSKNLRLEDVSTAASDLYSPTITGPKVNMCTTFTCTGQKCFRYIKAKVEPCAMEQRFCELKRTLRQVTWMEYETTWAAGCSTGCRRAVSCSSPYNFRCSQECCEAGTTSCLKLDGFLHLPSSAATMTCVSVSLVVLLWWCYWCY